MASRFNVTNGPSKFDLTLALVDGDGNHRRRVLFSVKNSGANVCHDLPFIIDEIGREDNSGESWLIRGHLCVRGWTKMTGCYNTRTCTGWVEF